MVAGTRYYIGNATYIRNHTRNSPEAPGAGTGAWLATRGRIVARMDLRDRVRIDARTMLEARRRGFDVPHGNTIIVNSHESGPGLRTAASFFSRR